MDYGFLEVANHPLIYILVICGILAVACMALVGFFKAWKRAEAIGMPKDKLMQVIKSSVSFSIIPSISIVVGFFALATMLGIPWPWWRLSVVGSLTYETTAANLALKASGVSMDAATGKEFILIMWVMTIGIIAGVVAAPFISERIQTGTMKMKAQDKRWGTLSSGVFMLAIIIAFAVPMFFSEDHVKTLTLITSGVVCFVLSQIAKTFKLAWLREFILVFTMLIAMAMSLVWTALLN